MVFEWIAGRNGNGSLIVTPALINDDDDKMALIELLSLIVNSQGLEVEFTTENITHLLEQAVDPETKVQINVNCGEDEVGISLTTVE